MGLYALIVVSSLYISLICNAAFYSHLLAIYPLNGENTLFLGSTVALSWGLNSLLLSATVWRFNAKALLAFMVVACVAMSYFSLSYGVVFNDEIIASILQTDSKEALELVNAQLIVFVAVFGLIPAAAIYRVRIKSSPWKASLMARCITIVASLGMVAVLLFVFSDRYAIFFREHKEIRYYQIPFYPLYSAIKVAGSTEAGDHELQPILEDAHRIRGTIPKLVVLVVGETVRSDHFSLNGYHRPTNPRTSKTENLYSYDNVTSCATSTAYSLPCMFSITPRQEFDHAEAAYTENVLDVLQRLKVSVLWRDNNSDSKGVALRVPYEDYRNPDNNPACDTECRDIGMLSGLPDYIDSREGDTLIVLHQMGNHGPAYARRYPATFQGFTPACNSTELAKCSHEEIQNAYDSSILYTDYFLAETIAILKQYQDRYDTTLIYVGDHGESLGENGVYLHGLPFAIAPEEQKHIPLIVWMGDRSGADMSNFDARRSLPFSHDEVSFTLLDMFGVKSDTLVGASKLLYKTLDNNTSVANAF